MPDFSSTSSLRSRRLCSPRVGIFVPRSSCLQPIFSRRWLSDGHRTCSDCRSWLSSNFWAARGDSDRAGHLGQAFVVGRGFRRAAVGKPALGHDSPDSVHNRGHDLRGGPLTGPYLGAVSSTAGRPHYHGITCKPLSPPRTSIVQRASCTATKLTD